MDCDPFRTAVSARLDGESPGMPAARLEAHLADCDACRDWQEAAAEVTRRARLVPAVPVPDVSAALLAALPAAGRPGRRRPDAVLRVVLLAVGVAQLAVALPTVTIGTASAAAPHLVAETAAWNLGVGACFLVVAALPRLAAGSLPFLLSSTAVLGWVTVRDLAAGHVHAERAGVHLLLVAGALLVSLLALRGRADRSGPAGRRTPQRRPASGRTPRDSFQRPAAAGLGDVGPITGRAA